MKVKKYKKNPILVPDFKKIYESSSVYNPSAVAFKKKVYLIYRAEDNPYDYVSRLCLATSKDGYSFKRYKDNPIFVPKGIKEQRGVEDPRITKIGDKYYMTYTAYEKFLGSDKHKFHLALATSKDLIRWKRQGIIFKQEKAGLIYPKKINGRYIMFFGEGFIKTATSKDLIRWKKDKKVFLKPRKGFFDSRLVEVGPNIVELKDKLLMIYNSSDSFKRYQPGFLFLDKENPTKVLYRSNQSLIYPEKHFELYGKVNNVIFVQGLIKHKNKLLIYYGGADKCIGVAEIKLK